MMNRSVLTMRALALLLTMSWSLTSTSTVGAAPPTGGQTTVTPHGVPRPAAEPRSLIAPERVTQRQHEEAQRLWDELHKELLTLGDRHAEHDKLPAPSVFHPFRNDKKRNQRKIDQLVQQLISRVGHSSMDQLFDERAKIVQQLKETAAQQVKVEEGLFGAKEEAGLFEKDKRARQEELIKIKKKLDALNTTLGLTDQKLQLSFEMMGVKISLQQVKDLFTVVSGSTMKTYFIRFSNLRLLSDMVAHLLNKSQASPSYSKQARRYYGVYVALVALLIEAHEEAVRRIEVVHRLKLQQLMNATQAQIDQTRLVMKQPGQEVNSEAYQQNLDIQMKLLNACKSYDAYLTRQQAEITSAMKGLKAKFVLVLNTYQTASLANQLITTIKAGIRDINDLQSLKLPEMIPLSDQRLREEFKVVDQQLDFGQVDDLRTRR